MLPVYVAKAGFNYSIYPAMNDGVTVFILLCKRSAAKVFFQAEATNILMYE